MSSVILITWLASVAFASQELEANQIGKQPSIDEWSDEALGVPAAQRTTALGDLNHTEAGEAHSTPPPVSGAFDGIKPGSLASMAADLSLHRFTRGMAPGHIPPVLIEIEQQVLEQVEEQILKNVAEMQRLSQTNISMMKLEQMDQDIATIEGLEDETEWITAALQRLEVGRQEAARKARGERVAAVKETVTRWANAANMTRLADEAKGWASEVREAAAKVPWSQMGKNLTAVTRRFWQGFGRVGSVKNLSSLKRSSSSYSNMLHRKSSDNNLAAQKAYDALARVQERLGSNSLDGVTSAPPESAVIHHQEIPKSISTPSADRLPPLSHTPESEKILDSVQSPSAGPSFPSPAPLSHTPPPGPPPAPPRPPPPPAPPKEIHASGMDHFPPLSYTSPPPREFSSSIPSQTAVPCSPFLTTPPKEFPVGVPSPSAAPFPPLPFSPSPEELPSGMQTSPDPFNLIVLFIGGCVTFAVLLFRRRIPSKSEEPLLVACS